MSTVLDTTIPPFDRLTAAEAEMLRGATDIEYFRPQEMIIGPSAEVQFLYVIIKGAVEERSGTELEALFGANDCFDSRALVQGSGANSFVAREETLCYLIPRDLVLAMIQKNARFGAFFYNDISRRLDAMVRDGDDNSFGALMRARVRDLYLHPAHFVEADATISETGKKMWEIGNDAIFVHDGARTGIITGMNLTKAMILRGIPLDSPIRDITRFDVVTVSPDDFVSSALIQMAKHNKRRLGVHDGTRFVGLLEGVDVVSFLVGNAQLIAARIEQATSIDELATTAQAITEQVQHLRRQGVKTEVVAEIVSDLNRHMFSRLFGLVAPAELRDKACLIVMGSEGRGEQTTRTDQDNGLILSEPVAPEVLDSFRTAFSGALERFGFPPCPGNVMVINPLWSRTAAEYKADFRRWIALPDADSHMNVAIFLDAVAVAGRSELLDAVKSQLVALVRGEPVYLAHFAKAIDLFPTPIGFFNNIITKDGDGDAVDLKKGGIFPIVHGVRSLALEKGIITETRTDARIQRLTEMGVLKEDFGRELTQAFWLLMTLRLDSQNAARAAGAASLMRPGALTVMERDLLRDAFQVVKRFRELLRHHFNLGVF